MADNMNDDLFNLFGHEININKRKAYIEILKEIGRIETKQLKPYKIFWENQNTKHKEPLHSKLLAYYLNPKEDHNLKSIFIQEFFSILKISYKDISSDIYINTENDDMDILIRYKKENPINKYAIIIENKVKGADDRPQQLYRYVETVNKKYKYPYANISIVYLPLEPSKPEEQSYKDENGKNDIRNKLGKNQFYYLSFIIEIARLLEKVVSKNNSIDKYTKYSLIHYLHLIKFMKEEQDMESKMQLRILQEIKELNSDRLTELENSFGDFMNNFQIAIPFKKRYDILKLVKNSINAKWYFVSIKGEDDIWKKTNDKNIESLTRNWLGIATDIDNIGRLIIQSYGDSLRFQQVFDPLVNTVKDDFKEYCKKKKIPLRGKGHYFLEELKYSNESIDIEKIKKFYYKKCIKRVRDYQNSKKTTDQ